MMTNWHGCWQKAHTDTQRWNQRCTNTGGKGTTDSGMHGERHIQSLRKSQSDGDGAVERRWETRCCQLALTCFLLRRENSVRQQHREKTLQHPVLFFFQGPQWRMWLKTKTLKPAPVADHIYKLLWSSQPQNIIHDDLHWTSVPHKQTRCRVRILRAISGCPSPLQRGWWSNPRATHSMQITFLTSTFQQVCLRFFEPKHQLNNKSWVQSTHHVCVTIKIK